MSREWSTPLSILVGSIIVSLGLYFALRPAPPSVEAAGAAARASNPSPGADPRPADNPFVERDRRRGLDDDAEVRPGVAATTPEDPRREDHVPSAEQQAMAVAGPLPGLPQPVGLAAQVEKDSIEAFDAVRSEVRDCWDSLPDDPEAPSSVSLDLSLSYGAEGNVLASGVSEDREARRDGLTNCLGPIVHGLRIPAPGANTSVQIRVTIP